MQKNLLTSLKHRDSKVVSIHHLFVLSGVPLAQTVGEGTSFLAPFTIVPSTHNVNLV